MNFVFQIMMINLFMSVSRNIAGLFLLLFSLSLKINAQSDTILIPEQFLFPEFSPGVVKMKNGEKVVLNLNYNVVNEKMVFRQKNRIYDMVNYSSVDTVYIDKRKFVPVGKVFYEVLVSAPVSLFVQHKGTVKNPSRPAAYGSTSDVSSSSYINNMRIGNDVFRMDENQEIIIESKPVSWIRKNNELHAVINQKHFLKFFSDRKNEIREFIRQQHLDIENYDHLINVVNYYNGLSL
ncbi:MAG: hypothetical protein MUO72_06405 [Bacteroidales bacterium]|nr:hypothetical protein [Bacteroidales bacterium]